MALLGMYPKDCILCRRDTCSSIFMTALFTRARIRRQARCPTTHDWGMKMWPVNTMGYYSDVKKNENSQKMDGIGITK